jgi:hypothetical protein
MFHRKDANSGSETDTTTAALAVAKNNWPDNRLVLVQKEVLVSWELPSEGDGDALEVDLTDINELETVVETVVSDVDGLDKLSSDGATRVRVMAEDIVIQVFVEGDGLKILVTCDDN